MPTTHPTRTALPPGWNTLFGSLLLASCATPTPIPFPTLDGKAPLVIAHRGASGYLPEETLEAYQLAIDQGADVLEMDLIATKDGVLIARHDPNLSYSTDVAMHPEFASRKRVDWSVDGEKQTGFFAHDFTLAELKTLYAVATDAERPQQFNDKYRIATFAEILSLVKSQSARLGHPIAIYPETKNPTYHRELGLTLEDRLIRELRAAGLDDPSAPVFVQSFEPSSLKALRQSGLRTKLVQLIDGDDYDFRKGTITYAPPFDRPYDWTRAGITKLFDSMTTREGLAEIKTYADGIGPWKPYLIPVQATLDGSGNPTDTSGDGKITLSDAQTQRPTALLEDAHKLGLFVHPFTFRNEARRLAASYSGNPEAEYLQFYQLGIDGLFSDFPSTALRARDRFTSQLPLVR